VRVVIFNLVYTYIGNGVWRTARIIGIIMEYGGSDSSLYYSSA
jgi:hypothetical protein